MSALLINDVVQVLGCCIFVAGCNQKRVEFEPEAMSIMSSLMVMVSISIIVPTTMSTFPPPKISLDSGDNDILRVSHGTAITLFIVLLVFFFFQFKTHPSLFLTSGNRDDLDEYSSVAEDDTGLTLNPWAAGCILITATLGMVGCAISLVKCVDNMARTTGISAPFTMIVLVPLLGNATKYATIVAVSWKGQVNLALRAIIGSNLRTLLVTFPVLVLVGWILDQPLTLRLDPFDATMFFLAVMVMNYLIQDSKSNYFEGLVLVGT
jgi:Ca2+:H+ antiporter